MYKTHDSHNQACYLRRKSAGFSSIFILLSKKGGQKLRAEIDAARVHRQTCIQVKTKMKCKAGKEPEGGKKRKEVGNQ